MRKEFVYWVCQNNCLQKNCSLCVLCVELVLSQSTGVNKLDSIGSKRFIITACQEATGNSGFVFSHVFCLSLESCAIKLIHDVISVGAGLCSEGLISPCSVLQAGKETPSG